MSVGCLTVVSHKSQFFLRTKRPPKQVLNVNKKVRTGLVTAEGKYKECQKKTSNNTIGSANRRTSIPEQQRQKLEMNVNKNVKAICVQA